MAKYNNRKTVIDGHTYDSKKEARRYCELLLLVRAGEITDLRRQVEFELIPGQYEPVERYSDKTGARLKDGRRCAERAVTYVADFTYIDKSGSLVVEDVKSPVTRTKDYIIKRKLMRYLKGIAIKEV